MKSNPRSALILAIGLCAGPAAASHAATHDNSHAAILIAQAGSGTQPTSAVQPAAGYPAIAPDRLTAADRALRDPGAPSSVPAATTAAVTSPATASAASNDGHSLWGKTSLIGKIFVGIGAVLTLASAARMFMT